MAASDYPRFPSTWPDVRLGALEVVKRSVLDVVRGFVILGDWTEVVRVPQEFHLRECAGLHVRDDAAIAQFVADYGPFGDVLGQTNALLYEPHGPYGEDSDLPRVGQDAMLPIHLHRTLFLQEPEVPYSPRELLHVDAVRYRARVLAAMVGHLQLWMAQPGSTSDEPVASVWRQTARLPARTAGDAWELLMGHLNAAVSSLSPQVSLHPLLSSSPTGQPAVLSSYTAACALVMDDISNRSPYKICANENCRQIFSRQLGGAAHGQHRRDARYCTPECTKATSARRRRRERKLEASKED